MKYFKKFDQFSINEDINLPQFYERNKIPEIVQLIAMKCVSIITVDSKLRKIKNKISYWVARNIKSIFAKSLEGVKNKDIIHKFSLILLKDESKAEYFFE